MAKFIGQIFLCSDCDAVLMVRSRGLLAGSGYDLDWYMVKDRVWRTGQKKGRSRFLCVSCLEDRIGRKLSCEDFSRSAKVNFVGRKSAQLRHRMRGLRPARRLIETTFKP